MAALEAGNLKNVFKNLQEIKPAVMFSVPTVAKHFRKNIEEGVRKKGKYRIHYSRQDLR